MLELLKHRRSIRTFTDEPVSQENIDSLLKAALLAPSSMGKKPVECIVVRNKETIARLKTYKKHGTTPLGTAPLAIVVIADGQKSDVWVEDASIVSILIQLEAEKLGLGSTWIQLRRREGSGLPKRLSGRSWHPEHYGVLSVVAIGHKNEQQKPHTDAILFHQGPLRKNVLRTLLVKNPCPPSGCPRLRGRLPAGF
ncbi:MAG: nitroreductase family protein [Bilophila wadsworthia]